MRTLARSAPLRCQDFVELVTARLEGALARADRNRFDRHMHACEGCNVYVDQLQTAIKLLGRLNDRAPSRPRRHS